MDTEDRFDIERQALRVALGQFIADTRPEAPPTEVEEVIAEVLTLYDELVAKGLPAGEASELLVRQAARAAAASEQMHDLKDRLNFKGGKRYGQEGQRRECLKA